MGSEVIDILLQYGLLGLWTASLLWVTRKQQKERQLHEKVAQVALRHHQDKIVTALTRQEHLLRKALDRVDTGLQEFRDRETRRPSRRR